VKRFVSVFLFGLFGLVVAGGANAATLTPINVNCLAVTQQTINAQVGDTLLGYSLPRPKDSTAKGEAYIHGSIGLIRYLLCLRRRDGLSRY